MTATSARPDWRRIKSHRTYTIEEIAGTIGAAKGTVRRWIKQGLPAINDRKPILVLGADLIEFHRSKSKPKQKCKPHECYCVKCRTPRAPAGGLAEYVPLTSIGGNLRSICPVCDKLMHRRVALASLSGLRRVLEISIPQEIEHLVEGSNACLNDTFRKER